MIEGRGSFVPVEATKPNAGGDLRKPAVVSEQDRRPDSNKMRDALEDTRHKVVGGIMAELGFSQANAMVRDLLLDQSRGRVLSSKEEAYLGDMMEVAVRIKKLQDLKVGDKVGEYVANDAEAVEYYKRTEIPKLREKMGEISTAFIYGGEVPNERTNRRRPGELLN